MGDMFCEHVGHKNMIVKESGCMASGVAMLTATTITLK